LIEKTNLDAREVGDIVVGSSLAPGSQRASECRMAALYAGFPGMCFDCLSGGMLIMLMLTGLDFESGPETVPIRTVNRKCSSGLQAVADVAASIKAGFYEIGNRNPLSCL
jgi:acetyl-CoA acyltransferase 1